MKRTLLVSMLVATAAFATSPALADHLNIAEAGIAVDGNKVTFPSVLIDKAGFIVIHEVLNDAPIVPASIGNAYLEAGTTENVEVTTDYPLKDGADYIAMLHYDTDGDAAYSFGEGMTDVDTPALNAEGAPYVKGFVAGGMM
jgi:hypothetical protein